MPDVPKHERETLRHGLLSRDSLVVWVLTTYRKRHREYPHLFLLSENAHLRVVHLRSPKEVERWLETLG